MGCGMAECSGRWTEELRKFQGGGEREKWKERAERRGEQDESEVIMCLDPQADSCHFCLPGTPLHLLTVSFSQSGTIPLLFHTGWGYRQVKPTSHLPPEQGLQAEKGSAVILVTTIRRKCWFLLQDPRSCPDSCTSWV